MPPPPSLDVRDVGKSFRESFRMHGRGGLTLPVVRGVVAMIGETLAAGTAILGIFHDAAVRERMATRVLDVSAFTAREAA